MRAYFKRKICLLLAVVMVVGLFPAYVAASESAYKGRGFIPYDNFDPYLMPGFTTTTPSAFEMEEEELSLFFDDNVETFSVGIANVCAFCVVENMGPGWNLGNTFDATHIGHGSNCSHTPPCIPNASSPPGGGAGTGIWNCGWYSGRSMASLETIWIGGSANATTRQTIQNVRNAGFDTIRIPVTWYKATNGPPNWTINTDWMTRVQRTVDWAYDEGMTVILNTHHEELIFANWLGDSRRADSQNFITRVWTQIATRFNNGYSERLIFEGLNEPRVRGHAQEWQGGSAEHRENVNRLNQAFVDAVRATGGNNRYRILMVPTYAASADARAFPGFTIPTDPTAGPQRIAMSIHAYLPNNFAGVGSGPLVHTFGSAGRTEITNMMNRVMNEANTRNVPVVFGEWGAVSRSDPAHEATRREYSRVYALEAASRRAAHIWWDNGATDPTRHNIIEGNFGLFNRRNANIGSPRVPHMGLVFPDIVAGILEGHSQGVARRNTVAGPSRCQCIAFTSADTTSVQHGVASTFPLTANRSATFTFGTPTAPAGVTISGSTLNIAATVPAGAHVFQLRATSGSLVATQTFTLNVLTAGQAPRGRSYRNLNMTPGADETSMRFTWHSGSPTGSISIWPQGNPAAIRTITSSTEGSFIVNHVGGEGGLSMYHVHQLSVTGLSRNNVYQYTVRWDTGESAPKAFRTGGGSSFQFIVAGDPQIGTGGIEFDRSDWGNAMMNAARMFPSAQMLVSMGDQTASALVDEGGDPANPTPLELRGGQRRYDGLLLPPQIHSLPLVPVIGNHDGELSSSGRNMNPFLVRRHHNVPNRQQLNSTLPSNFDYYFRYGDVLFIVLNSNQGNRAMGATRTAWFNGVVSRNQDALWRVVLLHHSPYTAHRETNYSPKVAIINDWIPLFEANDIDIVFGGHDHIYSRSHHMRRGGGSAVTVRANQRFVNSAGQVRHGEFGATYHAVLNPEGITYITFGSPTRSNARPAQFLPRSYLVRHHGVYTAGQSTAETATPEQRYGLNGRHISNVTVTPTTFSVATFEINNAAAGASNQMRMVDLYTIVRNPGGGVPPGTHIPEFDGSWQTVPDPYIDIPFNWNPNMSPPDINVSHGATNHIRVLDGVEITPCIIDSGDEVIVRVNYAAGQTVGSARRILAWTDISGTGAPANRNSIAFLTTANLTDSHIAVSDSLVATDTYAEITIPRGMLSRGTDTATRVYLAITENIGVTGADTRGSNLYTLAAHHRGHNEFVRVESIQLIARAASGVSNPAFCMSCNNRPCRCVETFRVEFRPNGGTRVGGGDLVQNIPEGGTANPPVVERAGHILRWTGDPFHAVSDDATVTAQWTALGTPINVLYDMQTTDRVGSGFATFSGTGGMSEAIRDAFVPLGRAGGPTTLYTAMAGPPRILESVERGGVSQSAFITIGGTGGGLGGTGANGIPVTANRMYRIEFTGFFPNGGTPRIRIEGATDNVVPVAQVPGGTQDGNHVRLDGTAVGAGVLFTHYVTLSTAQLAAIGARNISLSAVANSSNITYTNIRIIEHGTEAPPPPPQHTVTFAQAQVTATVGGTAITSGAQVEEGSTIVFTAAPPTGQLVAAWRVGGVVQAGQTGNTFTHTNLQAPITVTVDFESAIPTVILNPTGVAITNTSLSQTVTVTGTATGDISLDTTALPAGVTAFVSGTTITITGTRPTTDVPPIMGMPNILVTRQGVTQPISVNINLTTTWTPITLISLQSPPPTITLTQAVANVTQARAALPAFAAVETNPPLDGHTHLAVNWTNPTTFDPSPGARNYFQWFVVIDGWIVPPHISPSGATAVTNYLPDAPTLTLSTSNVSINDTSLVQTVTVTGGTATGDVTLNTAALPVGVTAIVSGTIITITGTRPTGDVPPITGTPTIFVTRQGVSQPVTVSVNLTSPFVPTILATLAAPAPTITLNAAAINTQQAISQLPQSAAITTVPASTRAPLPITWTFAGTTFNTAYGAPNQFTWSVTLPNDIVNPNNIPTGATVTVNNFMPAQQLTSVTPPTVPQLTQAQSASAAAVMLALPASTAVTTNTGATTSLPVIWMLAAGTTFNANSGAPNQFTWMLTLGTILPGGQQTFGTITVYNFTVPETITSVTAPQSRTLTQLQSASFETVTAALNAVSPIMPIVTNTNITQTLPLTWNFAGALEFNPTPGAANNFTWTAALPDGLTNPLAIPLTGVIEVRNFYAVPNIVAYNAPGWVVNYSGYNFQFTATGLPAPTWSVTEGSLPPGLTLSADGVLSGMPTQVSPFTFTVTAANSRGTSSRQVTVSIVATGTAPVISSANPLPVLDGTAFNFRFEANAIPPVQLWAVVGGEENLPPGLTLDPTTGVLSGIPIFSDNFSFEVTATNSAGPSAPQQVNLRVNARQPNFTEPTLSVSTEFADQGEQVTVNFRVNNNPGFANMVFRVNYPAGLSVLSYQSHPALYMGAQFPGLGLDDPEGSGDSRILGWIGGTENFRMDGTDEYINGTILTVTFQIAQGVPRGTFQEISAVFESYRGPELPTNAAEQEIPNFVTASGGVHIRQLIMGDVNGDGRITSADATLLARWVVGQYVVMDRRAAYFSNNGRIEPLSVILLARRLAGHNVDSLWYNGTN